MTFVKVNSLDIRDTIKQWLFQIVGPGNLDTPASFVAELRNADLKGEKRLKVLESLRVSLTSNPVR